MNTVPTRIDEATERLHAAGWSIGDIRGVDAWYVYGHRGEQVIEAHGVTQWEAWASVLEQAGRMPNIVVDSAPRTP